MVVEVDKDKVERAISRQREFIDLAINVLDVGEHRILQSLVQRVYDEPFHVGVIGGVDYSFLANDLRQDHGVVPPSGDDIGDLISGLNAEELKDLFGLASGVERSLFWRALRVGENGLEVLCPSRDHRGAGKRQSHEP